MTRRRVGASALAVLIVAVITGCANTVAGTATWPGARLDKVVLTAADFPPGVQYDRIVEEPGKPDGAGGPPAMLSEPEGCSDGLTRVIADSAERGPGSAAKYVVAYDGARMLMTVLTWPLDLDRLAATAGRCEHFQAFFDPCLGRDSDDHHPAGDAAPRRVGVPADHEFGQHRQQRLLLVRERRHDGCVRDRVSHTESRRSPSKVRCRRRFWTSPPNRPTAHGSR